MGSAKRAETQNEHQSATQHRPQRKGSQTTHQETNAETTAKITSSGTDLTVAERARCTNSRRYSKLAEVSGEWMQIGPEHDAKVRSLGKKEHIKI